MAGTEERRAQDARLDEDNAAHVILRNPILAAGHLAQQLPVDWRVGIGGVTPVWPRQHGRIATSPAKTATRTANRQAGVTGAIARPGIERQRKVANRKKSSRQRSAVLSAQEILVGAGEASHGNGVSIALRNLTWI